MVGNQFGKPITHATAFAIRDSFAPGTGLRQVGGFRAPRAEHKFLIDGSKLACSTNNSARHSQGNVLTASSISRWLRRLISRTSSTFSAPNSTLAAMPMPIPRIVCVRDSDSSSSRLRPARRSGDNSVTGATSRFARCHRPRPSGRSVDRASSSITGHGPPRLMVFRRRITERARNFPSAPTSAITPLGPDRQSGAARSDHPRQRENQNTQKCPLGRRCAWRPGS